MPRYSPGKRVSQGQYGLGTVVESNELHTVIDFDDHGTRRFITTMVALKSSTVAAPVKTKKRAKRGTLKSSTATAPTKAKKKTKKDTLKSSTVATPAKAKKKTKSRSKS